MRPAPGEATIRVVFEPGTDPNQAVVSVKIRVDQMLSSLPDLVQREGVIIMTPTALNADVCQVYILTPTSFDEKYLL